MAGNFAIRVLLGLVAKRDVADREHRNEAAPPIFSAGSGSWLPVIQIQSRPRCRISQYSSVGISEPCGALAVVEAIAQSHHHARRITRDQRHKTHQCRCGIRTRCRRQQHAARSEARAFLEMQVGHRQQALLRPIDCCPPDPQRTRSPQRSPHHRTVRRWGGELVARKMLAAQPFPIYRGGMRPLGWCLLNFRVSATPGLSISRAASPSMMSLSGLDMPALGRGAARSEKHLRPSLPVCRTFSGS